MRQTLALVADAMTAAEDRWWIIGSAAVALHGGDPIDVADVDVLASVRDLRNLAGRLGIEPRPGSADKLFRSDLFARWDGLPLPVEIMAGFSVSAAQGWQKVLPTTRERIEVGEKAVFVPSRNELRALLLRFGRPKDLRRISLLDAI